MPEFEPEIHDRGKARYFHGRKKILNRVARELQYARQTKGGTIILVQGPQGAGKTALLEECIRWKKEWKCDPFSIGATHLLSPSAMAEALYGSPKRAVKGVKASLAGTGGAVNWTNPQPGSVAAILSGYRKQKSLLSGYRKQKSLLLVFDEVQTLYKFRDNVALLGILGAIHNGKLNRPVVLLAGGLVTSERALGACGISRFKADCVFNIGRLSQKATENVIYDWLTKEGRAREGKELQHWIATIARESQQWAQHIAAFVQSAASLLQKTGPELTEKKLTIVLKKGRENMDKFYHARFSGMDPDIWDDPALDDIKTIAEAMSPEGKLRLGTIKQILSRSRGKEESDRLFQMLLHKGIFAPAGTRQYEIPIPSMRTWILEQEKEEPLALPQKKTGMEGVVPDTAVPRIRSETERGHVDTQ